MADQQQSSTPTLEALLAAGVHFGHQTRRWNPKMRRFIFAERNGIHIIDLQKTLRQIELAQKLAREVVLRGENVLFVCTANGGRSVIAERLLRREAGGRHAARSAGSRPGAEAHAQVVEVLAELGIDASDHVPRRLDDDAIAWADVVVATCDDACPVVPGKRYLAWGLPDPKHEPLERVREIRDDIDRRIRELVNELDRAAPAERGADEPSAVG